MSGSNPDEQILAGFGKVDITPQAHESFEIYDPIFFRALHVRQGDRQVTFLAADLFLFDDYCFDMMAADLADTDVDPAWVLPGASHMGTGPTLFQFYVNQPTEALKEFGNEARYARAAVEAVRMARADVSPARVAVGTGSAESGLQYNRRAHDEQGNLRMVSLTEFLRPPDELVYDAVDLQVGVVRFDRDGRRPIALTNFGCHALALWDLRGNVSADYPGVVVRELAERGIDGLFIPGALGNVHPVRETEDPCGRIGRSLARTALEIYDGLSPQADVELGRFMHTIQIDRQPVAEVEAARKEWEANPPAAEGLARYEYWLAETYRDQPSCAFDFYVVVLGDSALIHFPGEPFVETSFAIREAAAFERVLLLCNPCPEVGYLPTERARVEGDGEVLFAPLEMESETQIREGAIALLEEAWRESRHPSSPSTG
ncbi:MAG: hypothetical protein OYM47_16585 [Gemmatimonadota bacterium]|nr:hypothetical protein [Gemmatimonadota bacterium]